MTVSALSFLHRSIASVPQDVVTSAPYACSTWNKRAHRLTALIYSTWLLTQESSKVYCIAVQYATPENREPKGLLHSTITSEIRQSKGLSHNSLLTETAGPKELLCDFTAWLPGKYSICGTRDIKYKLNYWLFQFFPNIFRFPFRSK